MKPANTNTFRASAAVGRAIAGLAAGCLVVTTVFAQAGAPAPANPPAAASAPAIVAPAAGIDPALLRRASDFTYQQEVATLRNENRIDAGTSYPAYARRLAAPVLAIAGKPPYDLRDGSWAITIEKSPDLVFWSLPGGNVVMSSAFFEGGKFSAGELAALFAHAYAHEIGGHDRAEAAARLAAQRRMRASADPNRRLLALSGILVTIAKRNPFQIGQERQADTIALDLLARSGYDPRSLVMLMKKLRVAAPARSSRRIRDHASGLARAHRRGRGAARGTDGALREVQGRTLGQAGDHVARQSQPMRQPGSETATPAAEGGAAIHAVAARRPREARSAGAGPAGGNRGAAARRARTGAAERTGDAAVVIQRPAAAGGAGTWNTSRR